MPSVVIARPTVGFRSIAAATVKTGHRRKWAHNPLMLLTFSYRHSDVCVFWSLVILHPVPKLFVQAVRVTASSFLAVTHAWDGIVTEEIFDARHGIGHILVICLGAFGAEKSVALFGIALVRNLIPRGDLLQNGELVRLTSPW